MNQLSKEYFDEKMQDMSSTMATKEDLKNVKDNLKNVKDDLKSMATKSDINEVKEEVIKTRKDLSNQIELSVEELARMVNVGFEDMKGRLDVKRPNGKPWKQSWE